MLTKQVPLPMAELRAELDAFEERYGVPSERLAEAFRSGGDLHETPDFRRWNRLFVAWRAAERTIEARSR